MEGNNMSAFGGIVGSIIDGAYKYTTMHDFDNGGESSWNRVKGTCNKIQCKVCGLSTGVTLLKDGDDYICKDCKMLSALNED